MGNPSVFNAVRNFKECLSMWTRCHVTSNKQAGVITETMNMFDWTVTFLSVTSNVDGLKSNR